ncbi:hypothetical protein [Microbacterium aurantiacum]|uniref:hypothetical protein n=1 Tax=Microbacterium aurantiacum TaxID=162393 RepID=UPI0040365EC5
MRSSSEVGAPALVRLRGVAVAAVVGVVFAMTAASAASAAPVGTIPPGASATSGTVVAWGDNAFGQTAVPAGLADVVAIAAGRFHSLALHSDGTVTAWGSNFFGQSAVPAGLANVVAITAGYVLSMAIVGVASVDEVAPVPSAAQAPAANAAGWNNTDVTVSWNWSDGDGSGIDPAACQATTTSVGEGAQILSGSCTDRAGNTGTATHPVKIDKTAPTLRPTLKGGLIWYGSKVTVKANATDRGGSGIASSSCQPVNTSTPGPRTLTCTATDRAGNTTTVTVDYVVGLTVTKLSPPAKTKTKAGSAVPVTFTLSGSGGKPIPATLAQQLSTTCAVKVTLRGNTATCATYNPTKRTFTATVKIPKNLTPRSVIPISITAIAGTTTIASATTSVTIARETHRTEHPEQSHR